MEYVAFFWQMKYFHCILPIIRCMTSQVTIAIAVLNRVLKAVYARMGQSAYFIQDSIWLEEQDDEYVVFLNILTPVIDSVLTFK